MTLRGRGRRLRRDSVLFAAGLLGIGYETFASHVEPLLLLMFGLMAGVPGVQGLARLWLPDREDEGEATTGSRSRSRSRSSRR